jgi:hypothetical protein
MSSYKKYEAMQSGLFSAVILSIIGILMFLILRFEPFFYNRIVKKLFGLKDSILSDRTQHPTLKMYGKTMAHSWQLRAMIVIITTAIISPAILVFCDGCIITGVGILPNANCPSVGPLECTIWANPYFTIKCKPGEVANFTELEAFGGWCIGWIILEQSTSNILNQIGISTGLVTSYIVLSGKFLEILFQVHKEKTQTHIVTRNRLTELFLRVVRRILLVPDFKQYNHPWLSIFFVILFYSVWCGIWAGFGIIMSRKLHIISLLTWIVSISLFFITYFSMILTQTKQCNQNWNSTNHKRTVNDRF